MSQTNTKLSVIILSTFILQISTAAGAQAGDFSLETISIQEGCAPKTVVKVVSDSHVSVWKIECEGGDQKKIYVECQKQECRAKTRDDRSDTTTGHR